MTLGHRLVCWRLISWARRLLSGATDANFMTFGSSARTSKETLQVTKMLTLATHTERKNMTVTRMAGAQHYHGPFPSLW
jgi:hypothetical protein